MNSRRRIIVFISCFFAFLLAAIAIKLPSAEAIPALQGNIPVKQPNGVEFQAKLHGDEWQNWTSVASDDSVIVKDDDGYWKYAEVSFGELQPSAAKVGIDAAPAEAVKNSEWAENLLEYSEPKKVPKMYYSSGSGPSMAVAPKPAGGPQNTLILLVGFTDRAIQYSTSEWHNTFFGETGKTVKTYYKENSYGNFYFSPAAETYGTANDGIVSVTLGYAHPNTDASTDDRNRTIVKNALIQADPYVNFSSYDTNGNGYIETKELHIVTIVAGYERSSGVAAPNVWGHRWALFGTVPPPQLDGKFVCASGYGGYTQQGEIHANDGDHRATIGVLAHELGHDLGLPDLYNTADSGDPSIGGSSLMASGSWGRATYPAGYSGDTPTHIDPWGKIFLGFATPEVVNSGIQTVRAATTGAYNVLKFNTTNPDEYFLIENRNFSGFDAGLYKGGVYGDSILNGGVAVWHIDETVIAARLASNTVNNDPAHRGVAVEMAVSQSQPYFRVGSDYIFDDTSSPNSKLYSGAASGLTATVLDAAAASMRVQLGGDSTIAFSPTSYTIAENGGSVALTVQRTGSTAGALTVDYTTSNVTATAGSDYTAASGTLTFADGEASKTITVSILDDGAYEGNETFSVTLSNASSGTISSGTATVTVTENDSAPNVAFNPISYSVAEDGGTVTLTVQRLLNTVGALSVNYATSNITAAAGSDYSAASGTLNFADGEASKTITININDDLVFEGAEDFRVTLSGASLGTITAPIATVTITDNDVAPAETGFNPSSYTVAENGGSVTLTVLRTGSTAGALTVDYNTSNLTAAAGSDYTATSGTLTFAAGEASKTITVPVLDDGIYEGNETFSVSLSNASSGTISSGTATVTITENDIMPQVAFNPTSYTIDEDGAANITVTVVRSGNTVGTVTVDYGTVNGTAAAGTDYTSTTGTVSFADGETAQTINIPIIDDAAAEGVESFRIVLSNASGGAVISEDTATVNINPSDGWTPPSIPIELTTNVATSTFYISVSDSVTIPILARYEDGSTSDVSSSAQWENQYPEVATVTNGEITGVGKGRTKVTVSYEGLSIYFWVVVR